MSFHSLIHRFVASITEIRFKPGQDTLLALGTLFVFWPVYYFSSATPLGETLLGFFLWFVIGNLILNVLLPAYYITNIWKEPISHLGIKREGWIPALVVSIVLVLFFLPSLFEAAEGIPIEAVIPHIIANGVILWEPFFVYGWLQNRYERAFGTVPAIVLAGISFGLYHIGTYPLEGVFTLAALGLFFGVIYRLLKRNLIVLWPLTWAVASSIGTVEEFLFDWDVVLIWGIILLISGLWLMNVRQTNKQHNISS